MNDKIETKVDIIKELLELQKDDVRVVKVIDCYVANYYDQYRHEAQPVVAIIAAHLDRILFDLVWVFKVSYDELLTARMAAQHAGEGW